MCVLGLLARALVVVADVNLCSTQSLQIGLAVQPQSKRASGAHVGANLQFRFVLCLVRTSHSSSHSIQITAGSAAGTAVSKPLHMRFCPTLPLRLRPPLPLPPRVRICVFAPTSAFPSPYHPVYARSCRSPHHRPSVPPQAWSISHACTNSTGLLTLDCNFPRLTLNNPSRVTMLPSRCENAAEAVFSTPHFDPLSYSLQSRSHANPIWCSGSKLGSKILSRTLYFTPGPMMDIPHPPSKLVIKSIN